LTCRPFCREIVENKNHFAKNRKIGTMEPHDLVLTPHGSWHDGRGSVQRHRRAGARRLGHMRTETSTNGA
jgi:hypothetical protein